MDSNCDEIDLKFKLSKRIYYDGSKKYENQNINFNYEKNIQIEDLGDAKRLNSSLNNIKRLIQEFEKVKKNAGNISGGLFFTR